MPRRAAAVFALASSAEGKVGYWWTGKLDIAKARRIIVAGLPKK